MAKYLISASYAPDGIKGLQKEGGSGRRASVQKAMEAAGGRVEAFYFAFGAADAFVIADLPDTATAVALSIAVNATGAVRASITPLITVEEMDAAVKKTTSYRAPGA
jgi:uncharacterized protein with GYD domain